MAKRDDVAARNSKIIDLYHGGMLIKHIAAEVGVTASYVGVILAKLGVARPKKPQKSIKNFDGALAVKLWAAGLATSAIAERCGVSVGTVLIAIKAGGINPGKDRRTRYDGCGNAVMRGGALQRRARKS